MSLTQEIIDLAFILHGEQDQQLEVLCPAAEQTLLTQLRDGITTQDCHDCFVTAAAILSLSMLESLCSGGLESMDMGTLALRFGKDGDRLSRIALSLISPWSSQGIVFKGVRA